MALHQPKADFTYDDSVSPPAITFKAAFNADSTNVSLSNDGAPKKQIASNLIADRDGYCSFNYTLPDGSNELSRETESGGNEIPPDANDISIIRVGNYMPDFCI